MILRRVIEHVKKQHWTAIAIDFVIVVLGVFIANQVTTWKDDAALGKRKAAAIARLHDESEAVVDYFAGIVRLFAKNNAAAAQTLAMLTSGDFSGVDAAAAGEALDSLTIAPAAAPPRSAYDEIIAAGLFAETGDAAMRAAVSEYYATLSFLQAQIEYVRGGVNLASARRFEGFSRVYDPASFRSVRINVDLAALRADKDFMDYAVSRNADQIAQRQWWTLALDKAKAMCAEIARYDGRPCAAKEARDGEEIFGSDASPDAASKDSK